MFKTEAKPKEPLPQSWSARATSRETGDSWDRAAESWGGPGVSRFDSAIYPCQRFSSRRGDRPARHRFRSVSFPSLALRELRSLLALGGGRSEPWDSRMAAPGIRDSGPRRRRRPRVAAPLCRACAPQAPGSRSLADWEARRGLFPGAKNTKESPSDLVRISAARRGDNNPSPSE